MLTCFEIPDITPFYGAKKGNEKEIKKINFFGQCKVLFIITICVFEFFKTFCVYSVLSNKSDTTWFQKVANSNQKNK